MKTKKKKSQVSIEEYIETFCQEKRVRERYAVYVSEKTHRRLKGVVRIFAGKHHTTTSSLADSIFTHHFETYGELLNEEQNRFDQEFLEWLKGTKRHESEETEEQPYDVESGETDSI